MKVAVIDTGGDLAYLLDTGVLALNEDESTWPNGLDDDMNGFIDDYAGWDAIGGDGIPFDWPSTPASSGGHGNLSGTSHGAAMAEIVLSSSQAEGTLIRVVRLMDGATRVSASVYSTSLRAALVSSARVVLLALGGIWTDDLADLTIAAADGQGAVFVVASGNDGKEIELGSPLWRICHADLVLCVAASTNGRLGTQYTNSSYGPNSVAVAAFGGPIDVSELTLGARADDGVTELSMALTCVTSEQPGRQEIPFDTTTPVGAICPFPDAAVGKWEIEGSSVSAACVAGGLADMFQGLEEPDTDMLTQFLDSLDVDLALTESVASGRVYHAAAGPCKE